MLGTERWSTDNLTARCMPRSSALQRLFAPDGQQRARDSQRHGEGVLGRASELKWLYAQ